MSRDDTHTVAASMSIDEPASSAHSHPYGSSQKTHTRTQVQHPASPQRPRNTSGRSRSCSNGTTAGTEHRCLQTWSVTAPQRNAKRSPLHASPSRRARIKQQEDTDSPDQELSAGAKDAELVGTVDSGREGTAGRPPFKKQKRGQRRDFTHLAPEEAPPSQTHQQPRPAAPGNAANASVRSPLNTSEPAGPVSGTSATSALPCDVARLPVRRDGPCHFARFDDVAIGTRGERPRDTPRGGRRGGQESERGSGVVQARQRPGTPGRHVQLRRVPGEWAGRRPARRGGGGEAVPGGLRQGMLTRHDEPWAVSLLRQRRGASTAPDDHLWWFVGVSLSCATHLTQSRRCCRSTTRAPSVSLPKRPHAATPRRSSGSACATWTEWAPKSASKCGPHTSESSHPH
jgi:hypothetical protein